MNFIKKDNRLCQEWTLSLTQPQKLAHEGRIVQVHISNPFLTWYQSQIRDGKVKVLTPREAGYAIQLSNKMLLDVRPPMERKKAWVKGSTWIPIFDVDTSLEVGGWWSGIPALSYNKQFLSNVEEEFAKDTDLIVACQKGLRSIAACEVLYNAGYCNLFWVQGGLEAAEEEDLEREGPQPFKFAGIGGLSEFLGLLNDEGDRAIVLGELEHSGECRDFSYCRRFKVDEVRQAVRRMRRGRATGPDEIPVEFWKFVGEAGVRWLTALLNEIFRTAKMPEAWRWSTMIPLYKNKGDI
ncbi:Rhodanese-like domain-containing protein 11, chloroplastic [Capsicum annuum]|nr:Rhodanese-like domain-containing protein 11, chloroplastic [Capsicum annuum]